MTSQSSYGNAARFVLRPIAAVALASAGVLAPANAQWFTSGPAKQAEMPPPAQIAQKVGRYDFAYQVQSHPRVRPVQVFDDGEHTYFQFTGGDVIPAIFKIGPTGPILAAQAFEGPYLRVEGTAGEFLLRMGTAAGRVTYTGPAQGRYNPGEYNAVSPAVARAMDRQEQPNAAPRGGYTVAAAGPAGAALALQMTAYSPNVGARAETLRQESDPYARTSNSYAIPSKGDVASFTAARTQTEEYAVPFTKGSHALLPAAKRGLEKLASMVGDSASIVVVGREDDTLKEGLESARAKAIREVLVARGVPAASISVRTGVAEKDGSNWVSHVRVVQQRATPERAMTADAGAAPSEALARARAWQQQQGVVAPAVASVPGRGLEAPAGGFTLTPADNTIAGAVRRWADATGYQLVWEVPRDRDPVVRGTGALRAANMREAMEALMNGMRDKGYHIDVSFYSVNRVIVVTAATPASQTLAATTLR